jgi:methionyl-tRNA formyltransferase
MALRVIFMGSPAFSVPTLHAISEAGHEIACVYSQPPRAAGRRGMETVATPVHQVAEDLGLRVRTPLNFKADEDRAAFADLGADVAVVVAYGLLLPQEILDAPKHGCLNGHGSLLPRWRGAAPIQRAIMAGDTMTGIQIMQMEAGLDTGPVALSREISILPNMTTGELHDEMSVVGAELMVEALAKLENGELSFTPQKDEGAIYARKLEKAETRIDWQRPAVEVHNHIRGLSPLPGAWCEMNFGTLDKPNFQRVKILRSELASASGKKTEPGVTLNDELTVQCSDGAVRLLNLQRAGKKASDATEFLRGTPIPAGEKLR